MTVSSRLESLPIELHHQICTYLFPQHDPMRGHYPSTSSSNKHLLNHEPLISLAASSLTLANAVETFSRTLLLQWQPLTKFHGSSSIPKARKAKTTHRGLLIRWRDTHCVWCGKKSWRKAVLCSGLGCCRGCDKERWPDKIVCFFSSLFYLLVLI